MNIKPIFITCLFQHVFAVAQDIKPYYPTDNIGKIVKRYDAYDSVIVYGELCAGCITGTNEKLHIVYIKKNNVLLNVYNSHDRFKTNEHTAYILSNNNPYYKIYRQQQNSIDNALTLADDYFITCASDTDSDGRRRILPMGSDGRGEYFYIKTGNVINTNYFCCMIDTGDYKQRAYGLWLLMTAFKKETRH